MAIRLVLAVFAQDMSHNTETGPEADRYPACPAPPVSADGFIIVVTGPLFHPTTWLLER